MFRFLYKAILRLLLQNVFWYTTDNVSRIPDIVYIKTWNIKKMNLKYEVHLSNKISYFKKTAGLIYNFICIYIYDYGQEVNTDYVYGNIFWEYKYTKLVQ